MLKYCKVRNVKDPNYGTPGSAGLDLFIPNDLTIEQLDEKNGRSVYNRPYYFDGHTLFIFAGRRILIPSGLHFKLDSGMALIAFNKSGVFTKLGLSVGAAVVDSDYQGEVHVSLFNTSDKDVSVELGQKIVQFLYVPVTAGGTMNYETLEDLYANETTERGSGGFGSTGVE